MVHEIKQRNHYRIMLQLAGKISKDYDISSQLFFEYEYSQSFIKEVFKINLQHK